MLSDRMKTASLVVVATPSGAAKGYALGGAKTATINTIDSLRFSDETHHLVSATLVVAREQGAGVSSSTKGYAIGGTYSTSYPQINSINSLIFSTETSQAVAATLPLATVNPMGITGANKGYSAGGYTSVPNTAIYSLLFSSESISTIAATVDNFIGAVATSSSKGYIMGGGTFGNAIKSLVFSNESIASLSATLANAVYFNTSVSSTTKGYSLGGAGNGTTPRQINALVYANETCSLLSASLTFDRGAGGAGVGWSSSPAGYIALGSISVNTSYDQRMVEKLNFSNETISILNSVYMYNSPTNQSITNAIGVQG